VLVIFGLLAWGLASTVLPDRDPGRPAVVYWTVAGAASVLFFVSLVAHELAHVVVAKRFGLPVDSVTVWLFGGVSRLGGDPPTPRAELQIAVVGPLTSIAFGAGFALAAAIASALGAPSLMVAATTWLARINVVLGVFNLVPAFPLDGGRVLRAFLWGRQGDPIGATVASARMGEAFAWLLIGVGAFGVAAGSGEGLWFAFLGWFLLSAARAERSSVILRRALSGLRVRDVMTPSPITAPAGVSAAEAIDRLVLTRHTSLPLVDEEGRVAGVATLRRLQRVRPADRARTAALPTGCVPGGPVRTSPGEPLVDVLERLAPTEDGHALVFEADSLVGIVSTSDVARAIELAVVR
jgi:Zn-dependent protease